MPSLLATALQNTCIKAAANLTAQLASRWHAEGTPEPLDKQRILEFAFFGFIGALIGYEWHHGLERHFPTRTRTFKRRHRPTASDNLEKGRDPEEKPAVPGAASGSSSSSNGGGGSSGDLKINYRNVAAKLLLDQTISLSLMITLFLIVTNILRLPTLALVFGVVRRKLWGLLRAGWTIWPAVGLVNFLWVPVRSRVLVASCVGFGWNIFLSIMAARHAEEHRTMGLSAVGVGGAAAAGAGMGLGVGGGTGRK
ncbi:hypothetical protein PG993_003027 [Apiospora rasikravindrae]|uniref:Uncharacterized protein n=1 Tax=Apiospora rasikravindrae TaxID=990691 RepID=A0ABR1TYE7_9PEZI